MRRVGKCRDNREVFYSGQSLLDNKCYRGTFKILVDKYLGVVIKGSKNSKTLQVVNNKTIKCVCQVTSRKGRESILVKIPNDIFAYQKHIGRFDHGDHKMLTEEGF